MLACFAAIAACGAYWLSRLPLNVGATDMEGKSLETRLREHRGNHLDIRVELTAAGYTARLVAIRASAGETGGTAGRMRAHRDPAGGVVAGNGWRIAASRAK